MDLSNSNKDAESLAVIGLGVSNTTVVTQMLKDAKTIAALAESEGIDVPEKTIYLIDKDRNHGSGKAWGVHAHPSMLWSYPVIDSHDGFNEWLQANENKWLPEVNQYKDTLLEPWFEVNQSALDSKNYGKIHMPRYIYGMFKQEQLMTALENLPPWLNVVMLDGEVIDSRTTPSGQTQFKFKDAPEIIAFDRDANGNPTLKGTGSFIGSPEIEADIKLVGIGSPPSVAFPAAEQDPNYFADTTAINPNRPGKSFPEQFKQAILEKHAATGEKVKVGILGASLSCLDVINLLHSDKDLRSIVDVTSVSRSGMIQVPDGDIAYESLEALAEMNIKCIAGNIEDVSSSKNHSDVVVKLTDQETDAKFDIVVQTLGFGQWRNSGVLKEGISQGRYNVVDRGGDSKWLAVGPSMQMEPKGFANGYLVLPNIMKAPPTNCGFLSAVNNTKENYSGIVLPELLGKTIDEVGRKLGGQMCHPPELERFCDKNGKERTL